MNLTLEDMLDRLGRMGRVTLESEVMDISGKTVGWSCRFERDSYGDGRDFLIEVSGRTPADAALRALQQVEAFDAARRDQG